MGERASFTPSLLPRFAACVQDYLVDSGISQAPNKIIHALIQ